LNNFNITNSSLVFIFDHSKHINTHDEEFDKSLLRIKMIDFSYYNFLNMDESLLDYNKVNFEKENTVINSIENLIIILNKIISKIK